MKLVIDTSSLNVSVGIWNGQEWIYHLDHFESKHQQSKLVLKMILGALEAAKLKNSDIESIAVGIGPGSYTGLRVGLTIAKVWSFSMGIPVFSFSSRTLEQRTKENDPNAKYPSVKYLKETDFQKVESLSDLNPIYENDHFAKDKKSS